MLSSADEKLAILPAGARLAYNGLDTEASRYVNIRFPLLKWGHYTPLAFLSHINLSRRPSNIIFPTSKRRHIILYHYESQKFS